MPEDRMRLNGVIPATVTPFTDDNKVDSEELTRHVATVAANDGVTGVAVNGHAGEIGALSWDERAAVVRAARAGLNDGQLLLAGIEASTADHLEEQFVQAMDAGADGVLVIPPFDSRPLRRLASNVDVVHGLFDQLHRNVGKPIVVFQYPEVSGCSYPLPVLKALADIPSVVGIKAATSDPTPYVTIYDELHDKVSVLAACDAPTLLFMLLYGADGALMNIGVVGTPYWVELVRQATTGSADIALQVFREHCLPLMRSIFENRRHLTSTSGYGATKEALHQLGQLRSARMRGPAIEPNDAVKERIHDGLIEAGLLPG